MTERSAGSAEEAIIGARRAKAERARARGENPFANDVVPRLGGRSSDIAAVRALADSARDAAGRYDEARVRESVGAGNFHVHGRIVALRSTGGLAFVRLRDRTGEIQLLLSRATMGDDMDRLADLDVGDIVEAEGTLTASKRGELSIEPARLRLLTKAYRPLPEKWHGLTGRRAPLPTEIRRPRREPIDRGHLQGASARRTRDTCHPRRERISRSGNADHAPSHRRCSGAPLHHAPQRARHAAFHAHRPRALSEALGRGRPRAGLR